MGVPAPEGIDDDLQLTFAGDHLPFHLSQVISLRCAWRFWTRLITLPGTRRWVAFRPFVYLHGLPAGNCAFDL